MKTRLVALLIAGSMAAAWTPAATASYCGLGTRLARHSACCQKCAPGWKWVCEKVMKTMTRTRYEYINETKTKTVYDTVYDYDTVEGVHRVAETHYRDEEFTYNRKVYEPRTKEVPYTYRYPVHEHKSREVSYIEHVPSYETRRRSIPYTTYHPVTEQRTRTVSYSVPRTVHYTKTINVPCGHWETRVEVHPGPVVCKYVQEPGCWVSGPCQKGCHQKGCGRVYKPGKCHIIQKRCRPIKVCRRVWVPRMEQRVVKCCRTEYDVFTKQVPYTVTRLVPETHTYDEEYTVTRMVPVRRTKLVNYQVTRMESERRTRIVNYMVARSVQETGLRRVPFTTYRDVPTTRTVCVPRQVPRQVTYNVCRCVPHTDTYQVPCYIYKQVPCGGCPAPCQKPCAHADVNSAASLAQRVLSDIVETPTARTPAEEDPVEGDLEPSAPEVPAHVVAHTTDLLSRDENPELASDAFIAGLAHYRAVRFEEAAAEFQRAAKSASSNAKYAYFHALALYQADRKDEARRQLEIAVSLEKLSPIENWGRVMERVQGHPRLWVEDARQTL